MSYLDRPLNREEYKEHISTKSLSHRKNTGYAIDWFDKFCIGQYNGKSEKTVLADSLKQKYDNPQKHSINLFSLLQDFINYLKIGGLDPTTIRSNFNLVKNYLNWYGFEIYSESVKSRLNFPTKIEEEAYPLTLEDIKKIINEANPKRRVLYLFLSSTGMRISESVQIKKRDLDFSYDRIMVRIAGKYTKTKKPRKVYVTKETEKILSDILEKIKDDDLIFGTSENPLRCRYTEEDYFYRLRERVGLTDRYDNGIHKITLHSFRSWFVTKCNRIDSDLGNALAGHSRYMKRYDRMTDQEKCDLFIKAEKTLSIFDRIDEEEQQKNLELYQRRISELEKQMAHHDLQMDTVRELLKRVKVS